MKTPKSGEWVEGIYASEENPQKRGMFVREVVRPRCVVNPGRFWELTDGEGNFWQYKPSSCVRPTPATVRVRIAVGVWRDRYWTSRGGVSWDDDQALRYFEGEYGEPPASVHFIEAEVPLPTPQTIEGEVCDG